MTIKHEYRFDAYAEPQKLFRKTKYWEATLEILQGALDFVGATRVLSNLIIIKMLSSYTYFQVIERCARILLARRACSS